MSINLDQPVQGENGQLNGQFSIASFNPSLSEFREMNAKAKSRESTGILPELALVSTETSPGTLQESKEADPEAVARKDLGGDGNKHKKKEKPAIKERFDPPPQPRKLLDIEPISFNGMQTPELSSSKEFCKEGQKLETGDCFDEKPGKADVKDQTVETPGGEILVVRRSQLGDKTISGFIMKSKDGKLAKPNGHYEINGRRITEYDNGALVETNNGVTTITFKDGAKVLVANGKIFRVVRPRSADIK